MLSLDAMSEALDAKENVSHVEHHGLPNLGKDEYVHARDAAIAETESPWLVMKQNTRAIMAILSVQVSRGSFTLKSNS